MWTCSSRVTRLLTPLFSLSLAEFHQARHNFDIQFLGSHSSRYILDQFQVQPCASGISYSLETVDVFILVLFVWIFPRCPESSGLIGRTSLHCTTYAAIRSSRNIRVRGVYIQLNFRSECQYLSATTFSVISQVSALLAAVCIKAMVGQTSSDFLTNT